MRSVVPTGVCMDAMEKHVRHLMGLIKVLVVDDEPYSRKVIRTLLLAIGVTNFYEASDGNSGLEGIRTICPDVVLLDWEMPGMSGAEFMREVRSPATFPLPNVPVVMLTGHGERSRVIEAVRLGVHEFLLKPVSSNALQGRLLSVLTKPRTMVRRGDYYGPEPRNMSTYRPELDSYQTAPSEGGERPPSYLLFVN